MYYTNAEQTVVVQKRKRKMHRLFSEEQKYEVKPDLTEAIKIELESTYDELNKDSVEREAILRRELSKLTKDIGNA
ncbi:MAG: hypothetical protein IPG89_19195 [Bacteroidetes bacterium]|nr:hypothetical protein [Bacteroidota bacterium]